MLTSQFFRLRGRTKVHYEFPFALNGNLASRILGKAQAESEREKSSGASLGVKVIDLHVVNSAHLW